MNECILCLCITEDLIPRNMRLQSLARHPPPHPLPLFRGIRCLGPETESRGRLFPDSGSSRSQKLFPSCLAQKIPIFADISAAACVSNRKGNKGIKIGGLSKGASEGTEPLLSLLLYFQNPFFFFDQPQRTPFRQLSPWFKKENPD